MYVNQKIEGVTRALRFRIAAGLEPVSRSIFG
jgi:hypothetical protein